MILEKLCDKDVLKVLFGIYELTLKDFNLYISIEDIAVKCKLSKDAVIFALRKLMVQIKDTDSGEILYRIKGCSMHIPPTLRLFR